MKNQPGFTLIETLIYLALFTIVIGGGMVATYNIIEGVAAGHNHTNLQEEANFLMRKAHWALTGITEIGWGTTTLSTKKVSGEQIVVTKSGNNITLNSVVLNSARIVVSNLAFINIPAQNGKPQGITTTFTLITAGNGRVATQNFSTTKYLRQ